MNNNKKKKPYMIHSSVVVKHCPDTIHVEKAANTSKSTSFKVLIKYTPGKHEYIQMQIYIA